jgi:beta-glucosidase
MAINAGIDMSMVPTDFSFYDLLLEAVKKGDVPMSRIDDAVRRILILKMKTGLFDNPYPEAAAKANFGKPEYQQVALDAAHEAMTLLKNQNNILPLQKNIKVLVNGPSAQSITALNGCWVMFGRVTSRSIILQTVKLFFKPLLIKLVQQMLPPQQPENFDDAATMIQRLYPAAAANADVNVIVG